MTLVDNLLRNPDVSRVLCIAIAAEAQKLTGDDAKIDSRDLAVKFSRIIKALNRKAFADECRQLERLGPKRYLRSAAKLLDK